MKTTGRYTISAILIAGLMGAAGALAQRGPGANRNYDPKTVETVQGKVVSIENIAPAHHGSGSGGGMGMGIHLNLQTDKETIAVHLGPEWFMKKQTPKIETGDSITVTGSRVTVDGKPALIATEIKKGDEVVKLRAANGVPLWAGHGRHGN